MNQERETQEIDYGFIFNLAAAVQELEVQKRQKELESLNAAAEDEIQNEPQNLDGWILSPKQCALITLGDREAVDKFFEQNERRLLRLIRSFRRRHNYLTGYNYEPFLSDEDCYNQAYLDMRRGFLYFEMNPRIISRLLCHSFTYAPVGGFGDEDGRYRYRPRNTQGAQNVNS